MTAYERRTKQAAAIAGAAHDFDARQNDVFREDVFGTAINTTATTTATIPVDASLHLLSPLEDDAPIEDFEDEDADPPRCPDCGSPVEEMLRNYQPFTVCTESLADGANCAWFRPGKIADALRAAKEEEERASGFDAAEMGDFDYGQVPPPRPPSPSKTSKNKPGSR